jgi:hypothetical protein
MPSSLKENDSSSVEKNTSNAFPSRSTSRTIERSFDPKNGLVDELDENEIYDAVEDHVDNRHHVFMQSQSQITRETIWLHLKGAIILLFAESE